MRIEVAVSLFVALTCLLCPAQGAKNYVVRDLGCWKDTAIRAVPMLDHHLLGTYTSRSNAVQKCAELTKSLGYTVFAVQNGGWCASGPDAEKTYKQYGPSTDCNSDGKGGGWANQVYEIETIFSVSYKSLGCFADTSARAISPIEGYFNALHGDYTQRADAIGKCARSAAALGHRVFAVQNGGWCASAANAENTYKKYGASGACLNHSKGGPWANQVYEIKGVDKISLERLGCYKDTSSRALTYLEPQGVLPGAYQTRPHAIEQCIRYVHSALGLSLAAVQNGGACMAGGTYNKYGYSDVCKADSKGGGWANEVFQFYVNKY